MAFKITDVTRDKVKVAAFEKKLGKPVLALLEFPLGVEEAASIKAMGLKESDILGSLKITPKGDKTWSASLSFPPDGAIDVDGSLHSPI